MQSYISPSQYFKISYKSEVRVPSVPCYNKSPVEAKAVAWLKENNQVLQQNHTKSAILASKANNFHLFSCSMIILTHHIQFATEDLTNSRQNAQEQGGEWQLITVAVQKLPFPLGLGFQTQLGPN
jgi:hypothetical protein